MQTLYSYSGHDASEVCKTYARVVQREFYDGDLEIDSADPLDVTVQKAIAHPITLLRIIARFGISFRRTWHHIRENNIGVRVIWFVRQGNVKIVRSRSTCVAEAGQCIVLDSSIPFYAHSEGGRDGAFDALMAIVPPHLFFTHLPEATGFDAPFELSGGARQAVPKMLDLLCSEGDRLGRSAVESLTAALLQTIAHTINEVTDGSFRRLRVADKRLADIEAYIMRNLTDPDLSYASVAAKCGISPRYLCYVLKANNTSFSELVWGRRLEKARDWLLSPALRNYPIHEIAFMAGFKSAAHFSRMFKATYHCLPKDFRALNCAEAQENESASAPSSRASMC